MNLAQAFLQRKLAREKAVKSNQVEQRSTSANRNFATAEPKTTGANKSNQVAGGRTKEELLAIRKAMMKPSGLSKKNVD